MCIRDRTKGAVKESIKGARKINLNLVDAQQARRVLDRLVGYEISPIPVSYTHLKNFPS